MLEVAQAVAEENKNVIKSQRPMASAKVYQPQKINPIFAAPAKQEIDKYKQPFAYTSVPPKEETKQTISASHATKPFNRPTSHIVAKRPNYNFSFDA